MKMHIDKLINEYVDKIINCDQLIDNLNFNKKQHRRNNNKLGFEECSTELKTKEAQRQAYVQAKIDIESLLDYAL